MIVAFRLDSSYHVGSGHARRCLSLANALAARGVRCLFVVAAIDEVSARWISGGGHTIAVLESVRDAPSYGDGWDSGPWPDDVQHADARAFDLALDGVAPDWIVVDHYKLSASWEIGASATANILVLDDLANRVHDCDLLLDQTFGRSPLDYRGLVPERCRVICGPFFAPMRPEFAANRSASLDRRAGEATPRRVLVSLGGTDLGGTTARAVGAVLACEGLQAIDVVLAAGARSRQAIEALAARDARVRLHIDTDRMAALMRDADVAVGAAGTTSWERCCLGLPSLTFALAINQRKVSAELHAIGASIAVEDPETITPALAALIADPRRVETMTAAAAPICDGEGAARLASLMLAKDQDEARPGVALSVRPVRLSDARRLWLWRNDPGTRAGAREQAAVPYGDHLAWLERSLAEPTRFVAIVETQDQEPVGTVRFDLLGDESALVSVTVAPDRRGQGLGAAIVTAAIAWRFKAGETRRLVAEIRDANAASRRVFEACGFVPAPSDETGFLRFERAA